MTLTGRAIEKILKQVESRKLSSRRAFEKLKKLPYETLKFARIDHYRSLRKGFPEAIYAPGKSLPQLEKIIQSIKKSGQSLIVTRLDKKGYLELKKRIPGLHYSEESRIAYLKQQLKELREGIAQKNGQIPTVAVITGGTSDLPVAEEAALTLELTGRRVVRMYDCGVAGIHRLFDQLPRLKKVKAIICVAGMEGALPSVIAGLTDCPVVAVPTSVGYGASFKGIAPLLTMLNSCAQGVAVVNIDNGFGAACFAISITPTK